MSTEKTCSVCGEPQKNKRTCEIWNFCMFLKKMLELKYFRVRPQELIGWVVRNGGTHNRLVDMKNVDYDDIMEFVEGLRNSIKKTGVRRGKKQKGYNIDGTVNKEGVKGEKDFTEFGDLVSLYRGKDVAEIKRVKNNRLLSDHIIEYCDISTEPSSLKTLKTEKTTALSFKKTNINKNYKCFEDIEDEIKKNKIEALACERSGNDTGRKELREQTWNIIIPHLLTWAPCYWLGYLPKAIETENPSLYVFIRNYKGSGHKMFCAENFFAEMAKFIIKYRDDFEFRKCENEKVGEGKSCLVCLEGQSLGVRLRLQIQNWKESGGGYNGPSMSSQLENRHKFYDILGIEEVELKWPQKQ